MKKNIYTDLVIPMLSVPPLLMMLQATYRHAHAVILDHLNAQVDANVDVVSKLIDAKTVKVRSNLHRKKQKKKKRVDFYKHSRCLLSLNLKCLLFLLLKSICLTSNAKCLKYLLLLLLHLIMEPQVDRQLDRNNERKMTIFLQNKKNY